MTAPIATWMFWTRFVTPTLAVSILWLAVGGATIYYLDWVYHSHAQETAENFAAVQAADAMQDVLWRLQATVIEVAEQADDHTRREIARLEDAFDEHLAAAKASAVTSEAQLLLSTIEVQFSKYQQNIHQRLDRKDSPEAKRKSGPALSRAAHGIAESCKSLVKVQERLIADSTAQRSRLRTAFSQVMLVLWVVGPLVGIGLGIWIAYRLRRSIARISITLKGATGDLEHEVGRVDLAPSADLPALHVQVQRVSAQIRQIVDDLQQARRETMLADRLAAVGEMAAGVAHELRNPLTAVKLLIQAAADGPLDHAISEEHIHVVLDQVIRMENTIQGLLDFARPPRMQKVPHDLRDTLRRALNLVEGYAKQQGIAVLEDFTGAALLVNGDPEQLHQVFVNLLLNAVEAMPEGGDLHVTIQRVDGAHPVARVSFCDTGTGISVSVMQRLFEPFVTGKERGTGLGLAISRRIVAKHDGRLTAANRKVRGAEFTVELPLNGRCPMPTHGTGNEASADTSKHIRASSA